MRIITQWGKTVENVEGITLYLSRHKRLNGEIGIKWAIADSTTQEKLGAYKELDKAQKTWLLWRVEYVHLVKTASMKCQRRVNCHDGHYFKLRRGYQP